MKKGTDFFAFSDYRTYAFERNAEKYSDSQYSIVGIRISFLGRKSRRNESKGCQKSRFYTKILSREQNARLLVLRPT
jgi:hypothetical protein